MLKAINDLSRHHQPIVAQLTEAVNAVVASGWYINGAQVDGFEREFAAHCGVSHCLGVANGTDALEICLRAVGVQPGDLVATVANAGGYANTAMRALGALPLYIDIDPGTLTMSARDFEAAVASEKPAAVVITHLYGRMADVEALVDIARARGIAVVEDCAQSHGARRNGRVAGSFGDIASFSFYPTKNLGALGDGGAITTNRADLATRAKQLRQYGWSSKYHVELQGGGNSRLDELQAAVLRVKLTRLDAWNRQRRKIASWYATHLDSPFVTAPMTPDESDVVHLYVIRTTHREGLMRHLKEAKIPHEIHYPVIDPEQTAWAEPGALSRLPATIAANAEILTLPCFPEMTEDEVRDVAAIVNAWAPPSGTAR